jgi:protein-tyrosine phosphatase
MAYKYLLPLLGLLLVIAGTVERGWAWLAVWLGCDLLALAYAHAKGVHRIFGKRPDGTLPLWAWLVFFPVLGYTLIVWHLHRIFSRKPPWSMITEQLVVGRRLLASELDEAFDNYVDLTAELIEPSAIRRLPAYRSFPILNDAAPSPEALRNAIQSLKPGRTFVHCGRGYHRSALFALAMLLTSGVAHSVEDGLRMLTAARPGMRLKRPQYKCIQRYADVGSSDRGGR